jgi:hypothetical protein
LNRSTAAEQKDYNFLILKKYTRNMAQFNYFNDMNSLLNLDGELKVQTKPRWQRKMENSMSNSSTMNSSKLSVSYNSSIAALNTTSSTNKTPNKTTNADKGEKKKTPNDKKSPGEI